MCISSYIHTVNICINDAHVLLYIHFLKFLRVIAVVMIFHHAHLIQYYLRTRTFSYKIKTERLGRWLREVRFSVQIPRTNAKPVARIPLIVRLEMEKSP